MKTFLNLVCQITIATLLSPVAFVLAVLIWPGCLIFGAEDIKNELNDPIAPKKYKAGLILAAVLLPIAIVYTLYELTIQERSYANAVKLLCNSFKD